MSGPVHILDHPGRAVRRLVRQYANAPEFRKLVTASTAEHQTLEDEFWKMLDATIDNAEDAQLDEYGRIVDQPREGRDDETYRLWIKVRVRINKSCGSIPEIVGILAALVSGTTFVRLEEQFPAGFAVKMGTTENLLPIEANRILQTSKAGGVRAILEVENDPIEDTFTLDIGPGLDVGHLADYVTENWAPLPAPPPPGGMWTEYALPISASCVVSNGSRIVAAGEGIAYSDDVGQTWTEIESSPAGRWEAGVWDGVRFVLVGDSGVCATSPTGVTWTPQTMPYANQNYFSIASLGSLLVACGSGYPSTPQFAVSDDHGDIWTGYDSGNDAGYTSIAAVDDRFVAIAIDGRVTPPLVGALSASYLGETWTHQATTIRCSDNDLNARLGLFGATGGVIAIGNLDPNDTDATSSSYSTNAGVTWGDAHALPIGEYFGLADVGEYGVDEKAIAVGANSDRSAGVCASTPDGETWTAEAGFSVPMYAIVKVGSTLVAVGDYVVAVASL